MRGIKFFLIFILLSCYIYSLDEGLKYYENKNDSQKVNQTEHLNNANKTLDETNVKKENNTNSTNTHNKPLPVNDDNYNNTEVWEQLYKDTLDQEDDNINTELIKEAEKIKIPEHKMSNEDLLNKVEWEKKVSDFEPAEMLTFMIDEEDNELLLDPIAEVPAHIRLAFVVNDEQTKINLHILDPNKNAIFTVLDKIHLYHEFNATLAGDYIIMLDNKMNKHQTRVTFAIHQGTSSNTHLSHGHLDKLWEKIKNINRLAKSSRFTARMLSKRYDSHYEATKSHNKTIIFFSLIETGIMILIFFIQLFYIKSLANKINL